MIEHNKWRRVWLSAFGNNYRDHSERNVKGKPPCTLTNRVDEIRLWNVGNHCYKTGITAYETLVQAVAISQLFSLSGLQMEDVLMSLTCLSLRNVVHSTETSRWISSTITIPLCIKCKHMCVDLCSHTVHSNGHPLSLIKVLEGFIHNVISVTKELPWVQSNKQVTCFTNWSLVKTAPYLFFPAEVWWQCIRSDSQVCGAISVGLYMPYTLHTGNTPLQDCGNCSQPHYQDWSMHKGLLAREWGLILLRLVSCL